MQLKKKPVCKQHAYVYSELLQTANLFVFATVASTTHSLGLLRAVISTA